MAGDEELRVSVAALKRELADAEDPHRAFISQSFFKTGNPIIWRRAIDSRQRGQSVNTVRIEHQCFVVLVRADVVDDFLASEFHGLGSSAPLHTVTHVCQELFAPLCVEGGHSITAPK